MPEIRNCRRCGKIYSYIGGAPLCVDCREEDDRNFRKVKDYLYDNPGSSLSKVSIELNISIERIKSYLRDGRLEIVGGEGNLILECQRCGKAINTGRICEDCSRSIGDDLQTQARKLKDTLSSKTSFNRGVGMRYLSKDDDVKNDE